MSTLTLIGRIHGPIVAATGRSDRRSDRRGDDRPVYTPYTLQATGRRDNRSDSRGDDRPVYTAYNVRNVSCHRFTSDHNVLQSTKLKLLNFIYEPAEVAVPLNQKR